MVDSHVLDDVLYLWPFSVYAFEWSGKWSPMKSTFTAITGRMFIGIRSVDCNVHPSRFRPRQCLLHYLSGDHNKGSPSAKRNSTGCGIVQRIPVG
ncbi:hypothetical protein QQG55_41675 [Brugia pahangi]